jgi:hypothetical protein
MNNEECLIYILQREQRIDFSPARALCKFSSSKKKKEEKKKQSVKSNQISQFWGFGSLNVVRTGSIPRLEGAAG